MKALHICIKFLLVTIACLLMFICVSCKDDHSDQPWRLVVLNQEVLEPNVQELDEEKPYVPILRILEVYGYEIVWETETKATLTKNNKTYIFDLELKALYDIDRGPERNLIEVPDGATNWKCKVIDKDIFVDRATMGRMLQIMKESIHNTDIDFEERIVYIGCNAP